MYTVTEETRRCYGYLVYGCVRVYPDIGQGIHSKVTWTALDRRERKRKGVSGGNIKSGRAYDSSVCGDRAMRILKSATPGDWISKG